VSGENWDRREQVRRQMMAALDGELSGKERAELDRALAEDSELRGEWERLARVKEATEEMRYIEPPEETWAHYWVSVYNRLERGFGWVLVSICALVLIGYGTWHAIGELLADSAVPGFIKLAIFAGVFGALILLFSVIREKLFVRRDDRYKEVQR
jgi:ferric-dicitrate binding protein FerR (iron transport regulator)